MDATTLSLPALTVVSCIGTVCTVLVWIYNTFDRRVDSTARHDVLQEKVTQQSKSIQEIAVDVSFIRGKMEGS